jgi:peptidoglycan/LPS O-acetylase OafA/YrhL
MHQRLSYVDGLRAIAVLAVMVFHARVYAPGVPLAPWAKECSHGVDLFFVISGFCLALPTLEKLRAGGHATFDTVGFALKRCLRIFPPYAFAVALAALCGTILMARGLSLPGGMPASFDATDVIGQLLFLDRDRVQLNHSFWSLAIEFRWYLLFPLALLLAVRNVRAFVTVTVLIALAGELTRATSTDLGVLPAFMLGILAAYVRVNAHPIARYAVPLGLLAVIFALANEQRPHFPIQTNVGWHVAMFFFVVYAGAQPALQRFLALPVLRRIGIASYSIYLVHEPIIAATVTGLQPAYGPVVANVAALTFGLGAGFAVWFGIERPLTRPEAVAAFVARRRAGMAALFQTTGIPLGFALHAPSASSALTLVPQRKEAV